MKIIRLCYIGLVLFCSIWLASCSRAPASYYPPNYPPAATSPTAKVYAYTQYQQPITTTPFQGAKKIALLLPLHGKLAKQGTAIRNGFFAAYYHAKQHYKEKGWQLPTLNVIDTSQGTIDALYQQAIRKGADLIIGPLSKTNVNKISELDLPVPTLALNRLGKPDRITNLYQFGLSPIDEARQVAWKAWRDKRRRVLIIAPANRWGQAITKAFKTSWQRFGGRITKTVLYKKKHNLSKQIRTALGVTQSEHRDRQLRHILGKKPRYVPRRRQDVDMIFLVAEQAWAQQIKPLLNFYFAKDIPVYSISAVYDGIPNRRRDKDLDGILFCGMPWTLNALHMKNQRLDHIQRRIQTLWKRSYQRHPKLYALGVDAFTLIHALDVKAVRGIHGATGYLYLDQYGDIRRQLLWAKFSHGKPVVLKRQAQ